MCKGLRCLQEDGRGPEAREVGRTGRAAAKDIIRCVFEKTHTRLPSEKGTEKTGAGVGRTGRSYIGEK